MQNPLVTVIIPVYNVEEYLNDCLESVINQTYKNLEIITVNDGSSDKSGEILGSYALVHENITIISQKNSGQSVARNRGIEVATGKYIYFLDSDDFISINTIEQLVNKMEKNKLDLIRFSGEPFADNVDMKINKRQYNFDDYFDETVIYNKEEFLTKCLYTYSASPVLYIVRKDIIEKGNLAFKPDIIHEDDLFNTELFLNIERMMYDSNSYYKRRYRPNSTMTLESYERRKKSFDSRYAILKELNILLNKYTNKEETKLIQSRIHVLTSLLMFDYDIEKEYKWDKIKDLENYSYTHYIFGFIKRKLKTVIKKVIRK